MLRCGRGSGYVWKYGYLSVQGLGWLAINSVFTQDLPTVLGVVLLGAVCVALANLVADILYAFLDPRVRYA